MVHHPPEAPQRRSLTASIHVVGERIQEVLDLARPPQSSNQSPLCRCEGEVRGLHVGDDRIHVRDVMDPNSPAPASRPRFWVGTSGYNYAEWKGSFYPDKISPKKMLPYYAERLPTVEINYTFYRMLAEHLLHGWSEITPEVFKFTLKAPRRITHDARLRQCEEPTSAFCDVAGSLGDKLGVLLFQLSPSFKRDLDVLDQFLVTLPPGARVAFEFRHVSWHATEVFERLAARRAALCVVDSDRLTTPVEVTAPYAYFRLRDEGYGDDDIARWGDTIVAHTRRCAEVFVYFKHEEKGKGPELARQLMTRLKAI